MTDLWDHRTVWVSRDLKNHPVPPPPRAGGCEGTWSPPSSSFPLRAARGRAQLRLRGRAAAGSGGKRREAARRRGGPEPPGRCVSRRARADWLAGGERRRPAGRCGGLRTNGGGGRVGSTGRGLSSSASLPLSTACSSCPGPSSQGLERVPSRFTARGGWSQGLLVSLEALPRNLAGFNRWVCSGCPVRPLGTACERGACPWQGLDEVICKDPFLPQPLCDSRY